MPKALIQGVKGPPVAPWQARFAPQLIAWQQQHGRHHLPWQADKDPYKVWLSEVMLQQTQVATVQDYFARFTTQFPTVMDLANASLDEVMALWSGLGYYSRARNLHRCAQIVARDFGGKFPMISAQLQTLPGVGRSTAAAIAAICFSERVSILDGNAKRVAARFLGFTDNLALPVHEKQLWAQAAHLLPAAFDRKNDAGNSVHPAMPAYTQGLMDLGATLCTAKNPQCVVCPVQGDCRAKATGQANTLPVKVKQLKRTHESLWLLHASLTTTAGPSLADRSWWCRRPLKGIWPGLLCLPVFESEQVLKDALPTDLRGSLVLREVVSHALTHKDLRLYFVSLNVPANHAGRWHLSQGGQWLSEVEWAREGLPAPVKRVLMPHLIRGGV